MERIDSRLAASNFNPLEAKIKYLYKYIYERKSAKSSGPGIWWVGRSSRDQFFRIPHTKIGQ
jgi:hypothetical protein